MRYRTITALVLVSGAVALAVTAFPAVLADDLVRPAPATAAPQDPALDPGSTMNVAFTKVSVDKGAADVSVGTTDTVRVPYTYTLTATGVDPTVTRSFSTSLDLYRGSLPHPVNRLSGNHASCEVASTSTGGAGKVVTENCSGTVDVRPHDLTDSDPGQPLHGVVYAYDDASLGWAQASGLTAPSLRRSSRLTVNATPEPVAKGRTVTVVGALTRANWDTHAYAGYAGQHVLLQFRPKTSSHYTTLKTVTTDSHGGLRTTSKATVDGFWRYDFAGTFTTPPVVTYGDYVEVS